MSPLFPGGRHHLTLVGGDGDCRRHHRRRRRRLRAKGKKTKRTVVRKDPNPASSTEPESESESSASLSKKLRFKLDNDKSIHGAPDDENNVCILSEEEVATMWYSHEEYAEMKRDREEVKASLEAGETLADHYGGDGTNEYTCRGLEQITSQSNWALYEIRRDARNAVLNEQDNQRKTLGRRILLDPGKIAEAALELSNRCANTAFVRGILDRKDTLPYLTK